MVFETTSSEEYEQIVMVNAVAREVQLVLIESHSLRGRYMEKKLYGIRGVRVTSHTSRIGYRSCRLKNEKYLS